MISNEKWSRVSENAKEESIAHDSNLIIQSSDLLPGDVLLYRPANPNAVQRKISSTTGSPYTHAAIHIGDNQIADSNFPHGVRRRSIESSIKGSRCIAVFRSQLGFSGDRPHTLNQFVDNVVEANKFYDLVRVAGFQRAKMEHLKNSLDFIRENYGKVTSNQEFAQQSFFCSAFVVACYSVAGVIGSTAQILYLPTAYSPGDIHQDPTFGWLLGYLVPEGGSVPEDDPVYKQATLWRDLPDCRWWI